jgi:NAD(P)-dependent dehydrogenase (short-subunit alcohol dehydrogenase family)
MTDQVVQAIQNRTGRSTKEVRSILAHKQPIGRLVTPDEVAQAIMLCVANGAITGQGINVDGGAVQS